MKKPISQPAPRCVCTQLRRASRLVSNFYDEQLAPAGLTVTQYALLARIDRAAGMTRSALAAQLGMDRTTLTRNLGPLERAGLVQSQIGEDRREKTLGITNAGRKRLVEAEPLWSKAQERTVARLRQTGWRQLQALLGRLE